MEQMQIVRRIGVALMLFVITVGAPDAEAKGKRNKVGVIRGRISQVSESSVVVKGVSVALSSRTRFEDFLGNRTTLSAFQVGDCVKIRLNRVLAVKTAKEMELEDSCPSASSSPKPSVSPSPSPTPGGGSSCDDDSNHDSDDDSDDDSRNRRNRGRRG